MIKRLIFIALTVLLTVPAIAAAPIATSMDRVIYELKSQKDLDMSYTERKYPNMTVVSMVVNWNDSPMLNKIIKAIDKDREHATEFSQNGVSKSRPNKRVDVIYTVETSAYKCTYSISYRMDKKMWTMSSRCEYYNENKKSKKYNSSWESYEMDCDGKRMVTITRYDIDDESDDSNIW